MRSRLSLLLVQVCGQAASLVPMTQVLDTRGHLCPVPIIRAGKALARCPEGTEIVVISDDPGILADMPAFCDANGYEYLGHTDSKGAYKLGVRR